MSTLLFIKVTDYVTSYFFIAIFLSGCYTMDKTDKGDSFQMGKKQVTFADIAAYTNFSKTTISRYFNHPDSLTLENQEKISQALDTLGYKRISLQRFLPMERVNLSESLFRTFICTIIRKCLHRFFPATAIFIINFSYSSATTDRPRRNSTLMN